MLVNVGLSVFEAFICVCTPFTKSFGAISSTFPSHEFSSISAYIGTACYTWTVNRKRFSTESGIL